MSRSEPEGKIRIGLAQVAASADIEANLRRGLDWVDMAAEEGCRVCVFPEMAFHPFFPQHRADASYFDWAEPIPGPITEAFQQKAAEHGIVVVPNIFELAGPGRHYDASPIIDADGTLVGVARMLHIAEEPGFNERYYYWPGDPDKDKRLRGDGRGMVTWCLPAIQAVPDIALDVNEQQKRRAVLKAFVDDRRNLGHWDEVDEWLLT